MKKIIDILHDIDPQKNFEASQDFIADALLDSVDLQDLFVRLEEEYNIELAGTDLAPQNFQNIETIKDLLESRGVDVTDL